MADLAPRRDEQTWEQLVDALRRQLPVDEWTDHNASDPGIMLLELLCWLGEMASYRMDRVPEAHEQAFLRFLLAPPEPVTVNVTFHALFAVAPATASLTIPAGTLVATDFDAGRRVVFETIKPVVLRRPDPAGEDARVVKARAILEIFNEELGVSDGRPHQVYNLRPPRQALGITDPDAPVPVLTDFVHRSYDFNPQVLVGATPWTVVPSLFTETARIGGAELGQRCMVDPIENRVRFGDGEFGAIPPAGALISCRRYAVLHGPEALKTATNDVKHILGLVPPADVTLSVTNTDAEGGAHFYPLSRRAELGLADIRAPYRLVTAADFERAVLVDFNAFQELAGRPERIVRVSAVFDRKPPIEDNEDAPSHVTFVALAQDTSVPGSPPFDVTGNLWDRLERFLDARRLITTRLHQQAPQRRNVALTATVVAQAGRNLVQLRGDLEDRLQSFLSPISGGFAGRGWPLGRMVYRSQLFRFLEDADGVDHVESLVLSPADPQGNVTILPHELPQLQTLTLTVVGG